MEYICLEMGPIATNAYFVFDRERHEAVLVDAPPGMARDLSRLEAETGCVVKQLLLTHGHWDHMLDASAIHEHGAITYAHPDDRLMIEHPELMASFAMPGLQWTPGEVDHWLEGGETLDLLGQHTEVRHVPGHAPGSLLFYFPGPGWAFSGDALFSGGVGRYDLPGGDWEILKKSILEQIYTLPDKTTVFPGHGPLTSVGHEKLNNPFVTAA